jgi:hypothetical protein
VYTNVIVEEKPIDSVMEEKENARPEVVFPHPSEAPVRAGQKRKNDTEDKEEDEERKRQKMGSSRKAVNRRPKRICMSDTAPYNGRIYLMVSNIPFLNLKGKEALGKQKKKRKYVNMTRN